MIMIIRAKYTYKIKQDFPFKKYTYALALLDKKVVLFLDWRLRPKKSILLNSLNICLGILVMGFLTRITIIFFISEHTIIFLISELHKTLMSGSVRLHIIPDNSILIKVATPSISTYWFFKGYNNTLDAFSTPHWTKDAVSKPVETKTIF